MAGAIMTPTEYQFESSESLFLTHGLIRDGMIDFKSHK